MPYDGVHLYYVSAAIYLFDAGVVDPATISRGLKASRHLSPQKLKAAWDGVADVYERVYPGERDMVRKESIWGTSGS